MLLAKGHQIRDLVRILSVWSRCFNEDSVRLRYAQLILDMSYMCSDKVIMLT